MCPLPCLSPGTSGQKTKELKKRERERISLVSRALGPEKTSPKHRLAIHVTTALSEGTRGPWRPGADTTQPAGSARVCRRAGAPGFITWVYSTLSHLLSPKLLDPERQSLSQALSTGRPQGNLRSLAGSPELSPPVSQQHQFVLDGQMG